MSFIKILKNPINENQINFLKANKNKIINLFTKNLFIIDRYNDRIIKINYNINDHETYFNIIDKY